MDERSFLALARADARRLLTRTWVASARAAGGGPAEQGLEPTIIGQADFLPPLRAKLDDYVLAVKDGARIGGLRPEMTRIESDVSDSWQAAGGPRPVITAGSDGKHRPDSRHYRDLAFDLRANDIAPSTATRIRDDLARRIGDDYQVFYETFPDNPARNHIHVEYDPRRR